MAAKNLKVGAPVNPDDCLHTTGKFFTARQFYLFKSSLFWCMICHFPFPAKHIKKLHAQIRHDARVKLMEAEMQANKVEQDALDAKKS